MGENEGPLVAVKEAGVIEERRRSISTGVAVRMKAGKVSYRTEEGETLKLGVRTKKKFSFTLARNQLLKVLASDGKRSVLAVEERVKDRHQSLVRKDGSSKPLRHYRKIASSGISTSMRCRKQAFVADAS